MRQSGVQRFVGGLASIKDLNRIVPAKNSIRFDWTRQCVFGMAWQRGLIWGRPVGFCDSSVATGTTAAVLNPDYVTEVRLRKLSGFVPKIVLENDH